MLLSVVTWHFMMLLVLRLVVDVVQLRLMVDGVGCESAMMGLVVMQMVLVGLSTCSAQLVERKDSKYKLGHKAARSSSRLRSSSRITVNLFSADRVFFFSTIEGESKLFLLAIGGVDSVLMF